MRGPLHSKNTKVTRVAVAPTILHHFQEICLPLFGYNHHPRCLMVGRSVPLSRADGSADPRRMSDRSEYFGIEATE